MNSWFVKSSCQCVLQIALVNTMYINLIHITRVCYNAGRNFRMLYHIDERTNIHSNDIDMIHDVVAILWHFNRICRTYVLRTLK